MKHFITACIFFFAVSVMWGQSVKNTDEEVQKLLSKSWQMDVLMENGVIMEQTRGVKDFGLSFRADHTFDFYEDGNKTGVGEWKLIEKENLVALAIERRVTLVITSLSADKFIAMSPDQLKSDGSKPKMEVIFKVKE